MMGFGLPEWQLGVGRDCVRVVGLGIVILREGWSVAGRC